MLYIDAVTYGSRTTETRSHGEGFLLPIFRNLVVRHAALLVLLCPSLVSAQTSPAAQAARQWRQQHERAIVDELVALLAVPNVSSDEPNIQRNAELIAKMIEARGLAPKVIPVPGGNPVIVAELRTPGATRTIGFYAHYDGQPLDPKEWASPPFQPTLRNRPIEDGGTVIPLPPAGTPFDPESRLYARASADDKASIVAMLAALDAIRAAGIRAKANIKLAFEGEEEIGSPNLEKTILANKELFAADLWLICDGPVYQTRQQSVIFGSRGVTSFEITVYGARNELHSGQYGNWAPNPALTLARLLTSMKDGSGHVRIPGFYDQVLPLTPLEQRAIKEAPSVDAMLMRDFWLGTSDESPKTLYDLLTQPSLNIRGMASSRIGAQASNVIPSTAVATLDIRLVKGMDIERTHEIVRSYIQKQGFYVTDREPTADERRMHSKVAKVLFGGGTEARRTSMELPVSQEVIRTIESARGPAIKLPTMGGAVPLEAFERPLGATTIIVPMAPHDSNQHTFNENLRIQNLWDGIEMMAALLTM
jgi:acetylornithine deacetylase/succinyl-diaminopimelate desuccinylase-like protein